VLTLTSDATQAIERILTAPGVPSGAGIRIAQGPSPDGGAPANELQVLVAEAPDDSDAVIEDQGARVFVEDTVSTFLDDKELDAEVVDERVRFSLVAG
jgi:iron-sulfur cluster assembly protein